MRQNVAYTQLDFAMADFMTDRCGFSDVERVRFNAIVLELSSAQGTGHSCIELANEDLFLASKCRLVYVSSLASSAQTVRPLVLEGTRLYLNRYWQYETRLVTNISRRIKVKAPSVDNEALLDKYFPQNEEEVDWQRQAAKYASEQFFTIITGGPGTGKTTTVLKILALLQELFQGGLAISLAAPTGKAAMRLQQSLQEGKRDLILKDQGLLDSIPDDVSTLHRLLGPINQSTQFRHNASKPLSCDVLVVDESSMIDLALMSKLMDALSPSARLILLGDKDQLASVESGAVLNDLCLSLPEQTIELQKTWRFSGPIKDLAQAVNAQLDDEAWAALVRPAPEDHKIIQPEQQYSLFEEPRVDEPHVDEQGDVGSKVQIKESHGEMIPETNINLIGANWQSHIVEQYQPYISQVQSDTILKLP